MRSVIEDLYFGTIRPGVDLSSQNPSYTEAARLEEANYAKLLDMLDEPKKEMLEKFLDAEGELKGKQHYNTFTYAFKLGAMLMIEVFADKQTK